jgi:hypothetical protein
VFYRVKFQSLEPVLPGVFPEGNNIVVVGGTTKTPFVYTIKPLQVTPAVIKDDIAMALFGHDSWCKTE